MNVELMQIVEQVVRPICALKVTKLRMREDLYCQLEQIYQEEAEREGVPLERALELAKTRFGTPELLREELQRTVMVSERIWATADQWFLRRKEEEPLVRFAIRVGWHIGAAVLLYFGVLLSTALWWHQEGVPAPIWVWLIVASVLCAIEGFVLTLLGNYALNNFQWTERDVRLARPMRFLGMSLLAGLSMGAAEVLQIYIVAGRFWHASYWDPFLLVLAMGSVIFAVVLYLRARQDIRFRPWSQIKLQAE